MRAAAATTAATLLLLLLLLIATSTTTSTTRTAAAPTRKPTKRPTSRPSRRPTRRPTTKSPTRRPTTRSPTVKPTAPRAGAKISVVVPAYFHPVVAPGLWKQLNATAAANTVELGVIVNPNNGPGTAVEEAYDDVIGMLRTSGAKLFGYVYTSYGARNVTKVVDDARRWVSLYGISDGFFVDEQANTEDKVAYYTDLYQQLKSILPNGVVMTNPGASTTSSYLSTADTIMAFENSYAVWTSSASDTPAWLKSEADARFAAIVHSMPNTGAAVFSAVTLANTRGYGWVFCTTDVMPMPYGSLGKQFNAVVAAARGGSA